MDLNNGKNRVIITQVSPTVEGVYSEIFNTDNLKYGGSDQLNNRLLETAPIPYHQRTHSLSLTVPPLGMVILKYSRGL